MAWDTDPKQMTEDGYVVVPKKTPAQSAKGQMCGQCGMKFDFGRAYGLACQHPNCPMFLRVTS
jgi:hypothetical protein